MTLLVGADESWPELPWRGWAATISTLHMWVQIVGKVRMVLAPPLNHWWHVPLYVSSRGLTTSAIPYGHRQFQVDFDFVDHRLWVTDGGGSSFAVPLEPKSVARFYREFMDGLRGIGIDVRISTKPTEVVDAIPFDTDEQHASYDARQAELFWRGLLQADRVMKVFQTGFVGKASPVHFFWGSFDLAASRYSGRPAPLHPGGAPNCPDWVMEEAYSREESSSGWWARSEPPGPAFYSYTYPEPDGFKSAPVRPAGAFFDERLGIFVLPYDLARHATDPDAAAQEFFQTTYQAGADLGGWDRSTLEPAAPPDRPPRRPWSTLDPGARASSPDAPPQADRVRTSARGTEPQIATHCHGEFSRTTDRTGGEPGSGT
ncbi:MAG: DUF5996 family protein [Chloroflexota bacterium]|nr:DUF5996 family protein [Chloroflexota bacterium]